ncbi:hypothetical protein QTP88_012932 [Uroleucon formosanum]
MLIGKPKEFFVAKKNSLSKMKIVHTGEFQQNNEKIVEASYHIAFMVALSKRNPIPWCDESTDVANCCQLLVYFRFINEQSIAEELLFSQALNSTLRGSDVLSAIDILFDQNDLSWRIISLAIIKTKHRNRLDVESDLRCSLSNIEPNF